MRITGGKFGGRIINVPKSDAVRPTQDRVREALFSMLMGVVPESDFLDLFAGSGAVGLEAVSRGARSVMFVERDARHLAELKKNASSLGVENVSFVRADVYKWIEGYVGAGFDVAFADPPYALGEEKGYGEFLETLASRGVVRGGGFFVAEMTAVQKVQPLAGWTLVRDRTYGKTRVCLWRRDGNEENGDLKK
jgi:16S rRNA (guanine(966)-N(2))-methyltransferase RsmD